MADLIKMKTGTITSLEAKNSDNSPAVPIEKGTIYFAVDKTADNGKGYGKIVFDNENNQRIVMSTKAESADYATTANLAYKANAANMSTTQNTLAYFSNTSGTFNQTLKTSGGSTGFVKYLPHSQSAKTGYLDGLHISGLSYSAAGDLVGGVANQLSYGDAGPQIRFTDSNQSGAIIMTATDANTNMSVGFNFVTDQANGAAVKADGLIARTRAMIGGNAVNSNYVLYVNGKTYINGELDVAGNVMPDITNSKNIGTSDLKWANIYATTFHGTLDGNATKAGSLTSSGGTGKFWRGDNTWSNVLTDSITIQKGGECGIEVNNTQATNPNQVAFIVGASGNGGIYSRKHSKWIVYSDPSGNVVLNGNANTATALTSNAGSTTQPIYFQNGKPVKTSYALNATVNAGTVNQVAYYSGANTISSKAPAWGDWTAGTTAGPKANIQIGNATYTSPVIPSASASASGIITTGDQTFIGSKTFNSSIYLTNPDTSNWANPPAFFMKAAGDKNVGFKLTQNGQNVDFGWEWTGYYGAGMALRSKDAPDTAGGFIFFARTSAGTSQLIGTPTGVLTWISRRVVTSTNGAAVGSATKPVYIDASGYPQPITSYEGNAATATKATQDESGNNIKATYATSLTISNHTVTLKNKNDGTLSTITLPNDNTDIKQNTSLATTSKAYITGVTTTPTATKQALEAVADTGVYLTTSAGQVNATSYKVNEKATIQYNTSMNSIDFIFN